MTGSTRSCGTTGIMRAGGGDGIPALRAGGHFVREEAIAVRLGTLGARSSAEGRPDT